MRGRSGSATGIALLPPHPFGRPVEQVAGGDTAAKPQCRDVQSRDGNDDGDGYGDGNGDGDGDNAFALSLSQMVNCE